MTSFSPGSGSRLRLILVVINEYDASAIYASNLCANGDVELALLLWIQPYPVALRTNDNKWHDVRHTLCGTPHSRLFGYTEE